MWSLSLKALVAGPLKNSFFAASLTRIRLGVYYRKKNTYGCITNKCITNHLASLVSTAWAVWAYTEHKEKFEFPVTYFFITYHSIP